MSTNFLPAAAAGSLFGAALTASGVYSPSIIISQMQLTDFHMLKVFLGASASSAFIIRAFDRFGISKSSPRKPSTLGWFSKYDGNILGGALIGMGMTLTGACPGTGLVQISTNIRSGLPVVIGGIMGGISYAKISKHIRRSPPTTSIRVENHTVYEKFNVDRDWAILTYEVICLSVIAVALVITPQQPTLLNSTLGGLLIGGAQAASILLTGNPVGVSTAYEDIGNSFWSFIRSISGVEKTDEKPVLTKSIVFASGILIGSWALALLSPSVEAKSELHVSRSVAILGGFAMVFGARLAGGCTSGHGISGMSMLSLSSIITVMSMFGGGIALAAILK